MRIAQIAPLYESCPPKFYGGTERVVSWLTEEMVHQGHDVTLFASGDSVTNARLVSGYPRALRMDPDVHEPLAHHMILLDRVMSMADEFDILHFHTDYLHYPYVSGCQTPTITTLHGRQDLPDLQPLYEAFAHVPLVSISQAQRAPIRWANWKKTIHHGLPQGMFRQGTGAGGYLAFIGRISPEKRVDRAIDIARQAGIPLKVAAKVDKVDKEYYEHAIRPLMTDPGVQFIGEIGDSEKQAFLGEACGLLFPIDWPEPFGLVMIEAMACGTPVLGFRHGSVAEVIDPGVSGFIVDDVTQAVRRLPELLALDRSAVRASFERRFTGACMTSNYVALYARIAAEASMGETTLTDMLRRASSRPLLAAE